MAIYSKFSHQKWWFSIVTSNYQRVLRLATGQAHCWERTKWGSWISSRYRWWLFLPCWQTGIGHPYFWDDPGMILDFFRRICCMGAGNRQTCMNYWLTYTRLVAGGCSKFFSKIKGNTGNRRAKVRYMSYATYSWWSKWFIHDVLSYCFSTSCLKKCGHVG